MGASKEYMIKVLKDRGWKNLRVKVGSMLFKKYGGVAPIEECPEFQLRAIYKKGDHYVSAKAKEEVQGQKEFNF